MGVIRGFEYSRTRIGDLDEREYYLDDYDEWYTMDEIKELRAEFKGWEDSANDWYDEDNGDGLDWSGD